VKIVVLYWVLTQATVSSFTGLSTLPVVRDELVRKRGWITDADLNAAVLIGRSTPGPMGVYVVSVGQKISGPAGALAGWLALMTPAWGIVALAGGLGKRTEDRRFQNAIRFIVLAANGYALVTLGALAKAAVTGWELGLLGVASAALLLRTKVDTIWILAGAGLIWALGQRGLVF
jgi:chromate transporter